MASELVKRRKLVDVLFFKDALCGTRARPCPKYAGHEEEVGLRTAPDMFLFPQRIPSMEDPEPPVHTLDMLKLPSLILDLFDVPLEIRTMHVWEVHIRIIDLKNDKLQHAIEITHHGDIVDQGKARPWKS